MEYIEVLDGRGNPTGEIKSYAEVHRDGDWHRTVFIWVANSTGEILIQKRSSKMDSYPDMWDVSSAGHVSTGEISIDAAVREIKEELGLDLPQKYFQFLFTVTQKNILNDGTYVNNEFNDVYLVRLDTDQPKLKLQKEEISEVKFVPLEKLEKLVESGDKNLAPRPAQYEKLFKELQGRLQ